MQPKERPTGTEPADLDHPFFFSEEPHGASSLSPVHLDAANDCVPLSPELLARRGRLRGMVAGIVGAAAILSVLAVARLAAPAPPSAVAGAAPMPLAPEDSGEPAPLVEPPEREDAPVASVTPHDAPAAKRAARSAIARGDWKRGIALSRAAVERDPTDAELYLLLGSALQETGRWAESMAAFSACVHTATRGPKGECRALGGR